METLEKLRNGIEQLPKWLLLVAAAYVLSILSFVELPAALATVSRIVTVVCMIADIITVITSGKITFFAD